MVPARQPTNRNEELKGAKMKWSAALAAIVMAVVLAAGGGWIAAADPGPTDGEATPNPAQPSQKLSWALRPATGEEADGRVSLRHTLAEGEQAADALALTNFSDRPVSFDVYASDGTVTASGNFDLIPRGEESTDGGLWITLESVSGATPRAGGGLTIQTAPGETVVVPVTIQVPENATPGDHPAGIVAELNPEDPSGVAFSTRVGVRAHLRVSGDIVGKLSAEDLQVSYEHSWNPFAPGVLKVSYVQSNAGNVRLGGEATTTVQGPFGVLAESVSAETREILPGQGVSEEVELPVWPLFRVSGEVSVVPAVVGEDAVEAALSAGSADFGAWAIPWAQLALLVALAGLVLGARAHRRRSNAAVQARIDAAVAAAAAGAQADDENREVAAGAK